MRYINCILHIILQISIQIHLKDDIRDDSKNIYEKIENIFEVNVRDPQEKILLS